MEVKGEGGGGGENGEDGSVCVGWGDAGSDSDVPALH